MKCTGVNIEWLRTLLYPEGVQPKQSTVVIPPRAGRKWRGIFLVEQSVLESKGAAQKSEKVAR